MINLETNDFYSKGFEPNPSVLYIVGTPIGNLADLSPRALNVLSKVSVVACEDTRRSGNLLKKFNIKAKLISFHQHNAKSRIETLLKILGEANNLALISDAGLPGISDPGEELILKARKKGYKVICIPGPCAATTALVSSGLPSSRFCFEGFLPSKKKDRELILMNIAKETRTTVLYESPHRLLKLLQELSIFCGKNRPLQVSRELTKLHEENIGNTIEDVQNHFLETKPKGEFTLVLGGAAKAEANIHDNLILKEKIKKLIEKGISPSAAAKELSNKTNHSRNFLYSLIIKDYNNGGDKINP